MPPLSTPKVSGSAVGSVVTQAEDAVGFSVGRETLGLYSSSKVRGCSAFAAGNVRVERLDFDPFLMLIVGLR
ncbi:MAG TPA: hypothetical protein VF695_17250 [Sphingomonas sp.]